MVHTNRNINPILYIQAAFVFIKYCQETSKNWVTLHFFIIINKLEHFMIPEIYHEQDFKGQGHYSKVKGQVKVTP